MEFQALLDEAPINHRRTARDHSEADWLAERMVPTLKKGLREYFLSKPASGWDMEVPKLLMGYRMSKHASLANFRSYFLVFGR